MTTVEPRSGPRRSEVQAHRGASAIAPENTIAAFRAAAEQGAEWVELDVALLADGTPVVIHDVSIDRCSSSKGNLADLTASDLDAIDAGSWFSPKFKGEPLPTKARAEHTKIMISSFDAAALKGMHEIDQSYELAMLWSKLPADWLDVLRLIPAKTIHLDYKVLSIGFLEEAVRRGIKIRAWTCNDPGRLASFWDVGLTGVITDDPSLYLR
ncbi:glycerophosphoryl diester phosphodiesterase [Rhizobium leguminosarum bv. viciae]|uniref:Glycerophosphoryl diester phosphodiesterase n=1 Tax=Rhizobium leguminosarum bv. viciae TaxID=387 RepID=A0A8I2GL37_RHILV|nr:glycerophosphodiester phosphodiesterase family protein [Rhizobium leguminosarum]MBY5753967.1 glycerophosphoryl diester phosphodiesterase [Rhizobium leguminosarum]MBY5792060.1 glycerophosphoryl diester phosphodiesterase [Rhizobium leguminosarum]NKM43821.1 glycerophosphoryl diester phosphodiesterase [Rhizobium leguminosarum bv. viciae]